MMRTPTNLMTLTALAATSLAGALANAGNGGAPGFGPADALDLLKAGNVRFAEGRPEHRNAGPDRVEMTAESQHPFATVLACADSRVPVERLFDRGVGDLFTVRVAGNVTGADVVGSIEYGVQHLGTPVLVVLGHTSCGIVAAASRRATDTPSINQLYQQIAPAVDEAQRTNPGDLVEAAVQYNVFNQIGRLMRTSPQIASAVEDGRLIVTGAVYDLNTGSILWLGSHPDEDRIVAQSAPVQPVPPAPPVVQEVPPTLPLVVAPDPEATRAPEPSERRRRFVNVPTRP